MNSNDFPTNEGRTETDAAVQATLRLAALETVNAKHSAVVVPEGKNVFSLLDLRREEEDWELRRISGTANLVRPESFVDHVKRFKTGDTALFASEQGLRAVYDYHAAATDVLDGSARQCVHKAVYNFPYSPAWIAWSRAFGRSIASVDLAELLEDRIGDVLDPNSKLFDSILEDLAVMGLKLGTAGELMAVAREFRVSVKKSIGNAHNLATGEVQLEYAEEHVGARGSKDVVVPTGFLLVLQVHEGGPYYQMIVRLRYVLTESSVKWTLKPHRLEDLKQLAVETQVQKVCEQLEDVPFFWGNPEG